MGYKDDVDSVALPGLAGASTVGAALSAMLILTGIVIYLLMIAFLPIRRYRNAMLFFCATALIVLPMMVMTGTMAADNGAYFAYLIFGFFFLPALLVAEHCRWKEKKGRENEASNKHHDGYQQQKLRDTAADPRMRRLTEAAEQFGLDRC